MLEEKRYVSAETKEEGERETVPGQVYHRLEGSSATCSLFGRPVGFIYHRFPTTPERTSPRARGFIDASESSLEQTTTVHHATLRRRLIESACKSTV